MKEGDPQGPLGAFFGFVFFMILLGVFMWITLWSLQTSCDVLPWVPEICGVSQ